MTSRSGVLLMMLAGTAACSPSSNTAQAPAPAPAPAAARPAPTIAVTVPTRADGQSDSRVGLAPGRQNAAEAPWNAKLTAHAITPTGFDAANNSDLAFTGKYAVQGNYYGFQIYDVSNPASPVLVSSYVCPASQNDVSVYKQQLLFMSAEAPSARLDCGTQGVQDTVSPDRVRGIRIFDITDIAHPKYITSVQTCRGSHTHSVLVDPKDKDNIYIYVSGSSAVRSPREVAECSAGTPAENANTAQFRVEVIKVPLANPKAAAIAGRARVFEGMTAAGARHGESAADIAAREAQLADARAGRRGFIRTVNGQETILQPQLATVLLDSIVKARGGSGAATRADSQTLRTALPNLRLPAPGGPGGGGGGGGANANNLGPNQCHDITLYPELGIGGGACQGYGILLDIRDPLNPKRIGQVTDTTNMTAWHSVTFNNDATKILWSDEWGGGSSPKCRAGDPKEWGANSIFSLNGTKMELQGYYKIAAPQTQFENCVAHNGSLIPIPDRDVMVQAWYQGGISVFDWTDGKNVKEIAYFDRGPNDTTRLVSGGTWSAYWYNGSIYSSEIARGFDVVDLTPSQFISENELLAAKTVQHDYLNPQGQPKLVWPPSFPLACSYLDQLERDKGLDGTQIASARAALSRAEGQSAADRRTTLTKLASDLTTQASAAGNPAKVRKLAYAVNDLSTAQNPGQCSKAKIS